jgi:hypothetical protein
MMGAKEFLLDANTAYLYECQDKVRVIIKVCKGVWICDERNTTGIFDRGESSF